MISNGNSATTTCPECGGQMALVTWTGEKPACAACNGATVVGTPDLGQSTVPYETDESRFVERFRQDTIEAERDRDSLPCLAEKIADSRPANRRDDPIMVACPCPKCSVRC